jgi:O-antigen ligase
LRAGVAVDFPRSRNSKAGAVAARVYECVRSLTLRDLVLLGVCLLAFTTPLRQILPVPGTGTLTKIVGLCVFPIAAAEVFRRRRMRPLLEVHVLILAFACWAILSYFWTIDPDKTFRRASTMVQLVALVWLVWEFAQSRTQIYWVLTSFVAGAYTLSGAIMLEYLSDPTGPSRYSSAPGVQPNGVAFLLGLAIPLAWYLSCTARPIILKLVFRFYVLLAALSSLLTGSRGGLFTTAAALCIIPLTFRHLSLRSKALLAFGMVAAALALLIVLPTRPLQRLETTSSEIRRGDFNNRRALWNAALTAFDERPLAGVGAGASRVRIREITFREEGAHNTFLSIAADLGVVGLSLFCLILLAVLRSILLSSGLNRKLGIVLLGTLLLGLLPRHWEYDKPIWLILALMIGIANFAPVGNHLGPPAGANLQDG